MSDLKEEITVYRDHLICHDSLQEANLMMRVLSHCENFEDRIKELERGVLELCSRLEEIDGFYAWEPENYGVKAKAISDE